MSRSLCRLMGLINGFLFYSVTYCSGHPGKDVRFSEVVFFPCGVDDVVVGCLRDEPLDVDDAAFFALGVRCVLQIRSGSSDQRYSGLGLDERHCALVVVHGDEQLYPVLHHFGLAILWRLTFDYRHPGIPDEMFDTPHGLEEVVYRGRVDEVPIHGGRLQGCTVERANAEMLGSRIKPQYDIHVFPTYICIARIREDSEGKFVGRLHVLWVSR